MATTFEELIDQQKMANGKLEAIDNRFKDFFSILRADRLDMMELLSELSRRSETPTPADVTPKQESNKPEIEPATGFTGFAAAVGAFLTAQAIGFAAGVAETLKGVVKKFNISLGTKFGNIVKQLKAGFAGEKVWRNSLGQFQRLGFFGKVGQAIGGVVETFKSFVGRFEGITKLAAKFGQVFTKVFSFFRVLGKVFLPLTAIIEVGLGLFNEFNALDENAKWLDYIKAGIKGIIKGIGNIVMFPLDLLKNGVSWIMEKLGAQGVSEWLDSFSFSDIFGKITDFLVDLGTKIAKLPVAIGSAGVAAVGAMLPGDESPTEAFGRVFKEVWNGGESQSSMNIDSLGGSRTSGALSNKTDAVAQGTMETVGQSGGVTIINNNTNAPNTTQNNISGQGGDIQMPPASYSNGTRESEYAL